MASKIILKKSSVAAKAPVAADLEFGELALNYTDSKLYFKKADGTTIDAFTSSAASGTVTSVGLTSGTGISVSGSPITTSGNITVTNTAPNVTTNISTTHNATTVVVNSSDGTNGTINAATTSLAGVMTGADKTKLDGIAAGAQVNVATNLTYTTATTTGTVNSSTGTNATIPAATTSLAGLMTNTDKTKLDGIATNANNYSLPKATATLRGGVELASDTVQTVAANAVSATASRSYAVQLNSDDQMVVNVPWSDTNTTYSEITEAEVIGSTSSTARLITGRRMKYAFDNITANKANELATARTIGGVSFNGSANIDLPGVNTAGNQSTTGNAATANTLQTARTINGVSFNGSANITVTANTSNTLTRGTYLTGNNFNGSAATTWAVDATNANTASKVVARDASGNFSAGTITAALSGNASTATSLQTARTINGTSFNGSANITTANWGTARTLTIGNTGKSVNGSANVAWTAQEIGVLPLFSGQVTISNAAFTNAFFVTGDALASAIRFTVHGTSNGNVVASTIDVVVNHSQDIMITSLSGVYTLLSVKIISNDNDQFVVQMSTNSATATTCSIQVQPLNNESVVFTGITAPTGSTLTHVCQPGYAISGTGGNSGDIRSAGTIYAPTFSGSLSGNATTATTLQTARTINGVSFNGSANITVSDSTKQPLDADLTAIAALTGTTGLLRKTAANTWSLDTNAYVTSSGVTSVSGTAPIVSSGGTTPAISITAATTSAAGSMSAADKTKLDGIATGATANTGTVTSVGGTGSYGGLTLSGTVTTSGNLTLGGTPTGTWPISVSGSSASTTGNAATATALQTARTINGVSFNGSANITVADATKLPLSGGSVAYLGISNASAINLKGAGSGTYNTSWIYSDTTVNSWEAPLTTDASGGAKVPFILTWRGGYSSQGGLRLTGGSSGELGGNAILHAGNYNSYAPTKTGGGASGSWAISVTGSSGSTTGNAATATALQTARTIGGVSFNGTANINLPGVNTTGNQSTSGNAATATALQTARTINGVSFNGTANITVPATDSTKLPLAGGTVTGRILLSGNGNIAYSDSGGTYIPRPLGGSYKTTTSAITGALTIQLPTASTGASDMMSFWVDIYDYNANETVSIFVYGYPNGSAGSWANCGATILTPRTDRDYNVRFGHSSNRHVVCIGEVGSTWSYPQVIVRDVQAGYTASADTLDDGWGITFLTTLPTIIVTSSGNTVVAKQLQTARTIGGVSFDGTANINLPGVNTTGNQSTTGSAATLTTARTINGTSFNGSANITTANWGTARTINGTSINGSTNYTTANWGTARTLTIGGTGKSVNGSANVAWTVAEVIPATTALSVASLTASGNVVANSDENLKKDWVELPSTFVEDLSKVKTGTYTRIDSGERQAGSSAQDWQKLLPEVVVKASNEEGTLSLAYGNAALVSAVELAKKVVSLEERLAKLEKLIQ